MGTLLNQKPRNYRHLDERDVLLKIDEIKDISKVKKITFDQALKVYELLEQERSNNLYVANGDIKDEQLAGFGELIIKYIESIK